ncbi:AhpC/TSA family protein [Novosphingobium sp. KCTC 2891]|uniref:peroxiredoxin-like family protein n=1 Tax=Novosphingobium sp. KCTC 2891 TaxID=2989730 RepID=UPI0022218326|nr:peroxiredoxin-like family protein [Novosphingobium sp. KCTC 2891]MCW1383562.1 AhpC/TSA family protein [Novosphingobium sp. KCTC 2891]
MTTRSLADRFAELQAERERTWPAEQLAKNTAQRRVLVERFNREERPGAGDRIDPFTLIDADGNQVSSQQILANGPVVLVFFRFGGCPACNIALPYYDETLWPALTAAGVPLLAVSAQIPVDKGPTERHGLRFPTYSDPDYTLGRRLGLTFLPEDQPPVQPGQPWIGATLGTHSYEITEPAVIVIEPDHTIRFIDASPDWLTRTEAEAVLAHVPEAATAPVA